MCKIGCNDFSVWTCSARTCYWKKDQHRLIPAALAGIPITDVCFICHWSQREEAEMKVRIGEERARCKNLHLSILITAMVIIRDMAKIKYTACLRDLCINCSWTAI